MIYAQPRIRPGKWDAQNSLGFWDTNGSPILGQTTRHSDSQQKNKKTKTKTKNKKRSCWTVGFTVPAVHRVKLKEGEKEDKYLDLARERKKLWSTLKTTLKISIWKIPGHDGIHGFWFKKFTSIHDRQALEMNRCLQGAHVPEWMTKGKTTLTQEDTLEGIALNNYRPAYRWCGKY